MGVGLAGATWAIARKDLLIELRTRTTFIAAGVFALLGVSIFYFAWDPTAIPAVDLAPGVLWVIFTFSGLLGLHRSFGLEQDSRAIDALVTSAAPRESIFLGKALANLVFVLAVQAIAIPAVALMYNLPLGGTVLALAGLAVLASVGLVAVGTLFSAMAVNTRMAELLLPVLALPFFVPIVMPAAQATAKLLAGRPADEIYSWLKLLLAFDLVFVFACTMIYPWTFEE